MQEHQTMLMMDKATYFPEYDKLEKLFQLIYRTPKYSGYGIGGVFDDVIAWVIEVCVKLNTDPDNVTQVAIPNLTSVGKRADEYQELFLAAAINICKLIPAGTHTIYPILCKGDNISLCVFYYGKCWYKHEYIDRIRLEQFRKALGRRRKPKAN